MIGAIQSNFGGTLPRLAENALTDTQKTEVSALLADYDPDNLSSETASEIVSGIKELGISPGVGLATALNDAGFKPFEIANLAGIGREGGPPPPPPGIGPGQGAGSVDSDLVSLVLDALENSETEDGQSPWSNLFSALEEAGYDPTQPVVDFYA
ncbi:MAG: hypothetical protein AAFX45_14880 [Pseudomonadota bacterium]